RQRKPSGGLVDEWGGGYAGTGRTGTRGLPFCSGARGGYKAVWASPCQQLESGTAMTKQAQSRGGDSVNTEDGRATERERTLSAMLSMRIVHLFLMLRRSSSEIQPRELVLSRLEWRVMTQLDGTKPHSLTTLADRLMLDRGQLSRAVKDMVERGLLT